MIIFFDRERGQEKASKKKKKSFYAETNPFHGEWGQRRAGYEQKMASIWLYRGQGNTNKEDGTYGKICFFSY